GCVEFASVRYVGVAVISKFPARPGEAGSGSRLEHVFDPVPHVMHSNRDIDDLTVMEAAFLALEDLAGLLLRADGGETFFRERQRNLLIAGAMLEQERTGHLLHDAVKPERFERLEGRRRARYPEHPLQMLRRHG